MARQRPTHPFEPGDPRTWAKGVIPDPERWRRIEEIFHQVLESEPDSRSDLLHDICRGDDELRREVESLLDSSTSADDRIDSVMSNAIGLVANGDGEGAANREHIGPYRVIGELGQGGLARVYLAERSDQEFRMRVAVKVVKRGMATTDILRRQRQERQILASLDHPHIARLFDGGTTDDGLPYFVMEYIEGEPIDEYCDRHALDIDQRLEIFRAVCAAVQYAHQSLVIHRDLKPSNILVTAGGVPKLLDFGIAKLLDSEIVPQTLARTMTGLRLLTPEYASPEQVQGRPLTTGTDVYSLGVMLYRLLTGHRPYSFETGSPGEIERVITEVDPEKPSQAIARAGPEAASRVGEGTPDKLSRRLAGDLDNIVMMAMRKEPQRRYASVEQLASDVERHLRSQPVVARRDTLRYRTRKFVRRHRGGVVAAALVTLALVAGIATTSWQAHIARSEYARAEENLAEARSQSIRAGHVLSLLVDLFRVSDPMENRGDELTVREVLDDGAVKIRRALADQPLDRVQLMGTLGQVYQNLGLYDRALGLRREALDLHRQVVGAHHPEVADDLNAVASVLSDKGEFVAAEELLEEALAILDQAPVADPAILGAVLNTLAGVRLNKGDTASAEDLYQRTLKLRRETFGDDSLEVIRTLNQLGEMYYARDRIDAAEASFRQALDRAERLGDDHPDVADAFNNLAAVLDRRRDYDAAEELLRRALALNLRIFGEEHPDVAVSFNNLATILQAQDRHDQAAPLLRQALAIYEQRLGPGHRKTVTGMTNLAVSLQAHGEREEAEELFRGALARSREQFGEEHPDVAWILFRLAVFIAEVDPSRAESLFEQALQIQRRMFEANDYRIAITLIRIARLRGLRGDHARAEPLLREAVDIRRQILPAGDVALEAAESLLRECLTALGKS